jgi:hypothetical protein
MNTDKSPTQSLIDTKTVKNLALLPSEDRLKLQETLRQTEARYWIKRFKKMAKEEGQSEALAWWQKTLSDLVKKRGQPAVDELRQRMNDEIRR